MKINLQIADFLDDLNVKKADDYEKIARNVNDLEFFHLYFHWKSLENVSILINSYQAYQLCSDSTTEELSIEMLTGRLDEVQTDLLDLFVISYNQQ